MRRGGSASTSLRDGIRLISRSFNCAVCDSKKSIKRRAAAGCGALCASITLLTITNHGLQRYPFYGRPLIDEALRMRPIAYCERRFSCRDELDASTCAALEDLILLRQPAKIRESFVASPRFQQSIEPFEIVRVVDDLPAFPHRLQQIVVGFRNIVSFHISFVVSEYKGILKRR